MSFFFRSCGTRGSSGRPWGLALFFYGCVPLELNGTGTKMAPKMPPAPKIKPTITLCSPDDDLMSASHFVSGIVPSLCSLSLSREREASCTLLLVLLQSSCCYPSKNSSYKLFVDRTFGTKVIVFLFSSLIESILG